MTEQPPGEDTNGTDRHLLVPIAETITSRDTVDYAVRQAGHGSVHLVVARGERYDERKDRSDDAERLLSRARAWAIEDAGDRDLRIESHIIGTDRQLFGPGDYARLFASYVADRNIDAIVLDPEYWADTTGSLVESFRAELANQGVQTEYPPTPRPARHERIVGRWNTNKLVFVFVISTGFYLTLGDPLYWFDLVTGVAVGLIVALTLSHVTYGRAPTVPASIFSTIRFGLYIPYLVWEIVKANIAIAVVILRPSMPIDPRVTRVRARVDSGLPLLALANSITLTPGTLTVRASDDQLIIHTLVPAARTDLFDGRLERAVRFVFYGRDEMAIPSPRDRGEAEVLEEDDPV